MGGPGLGIAVALARAELHQLVQAAACGRRRSRRLRGHQVALALLNHAAAQALRKLKHLAAAWTLGRLGRGAESHFAERADHRLRAGAFRALARLAAAAALLLPAAQVPIA